MSTHTIYMKDGVKMMRPVHNREEYLALRNGGVGHVQVRDGLLKLAVLDFGHGDERLLVQLIRLVESPKRHADERPVVVESAK